MRSSNGRFGETGCWAAISKTMSAATAVKTALHLVFGCLIHLTGSFPTAQRGFPDATLLPHSARAPWPVAPKPTITSAPQESDKRWARHQRVPDLAASCDRPAPRQPPEPAAIRLKPSLERPKGPDTAKGVMMSFRPALQSGRECLRAIPSTSPESRPWKKQAPSELCRSTSGTSPPRRRQGHPAL